MSREQGSAFLAGSTIAGQVERLPGGTGSSPLRAEKGRGAVGRETGFWQDRPVLVTGGGGFLGGWLVRALLRRGAAVVCLLRDRDPRSFVRRRSLRRRIVSVRGDVTDGLLLERILGEYEINTVFHLAAQALVPVANCNPLSTFESNIRGSWTLLEACRRSPLVGEIIFASSDKAYGAQDKLPYDEGMPLQGLYPYDASKACGDILAQSYAATFGLPVVITRCGNFFGGGDTNYNRLVPGTIRSLLRGKRPLIRSDGKFVRDYFYVEDGAEAYILLAEKLASDAALAGEAFNFSFERPLKVRELVEMISTVVGTNLEPLVLGEASGEIRDQYLSAAKARRLLGWQPLFSMEKALRRTVAWYRRHLHC